MLTKEEEATLEKARAIPTSSSGASLAQPVIDLMLRNYATLRLEFSKTKSTAIAYMATWSGIGKTKLREIVDFYEANGELLGVLFLLQFISLFLFCHIFYLFIVIV